MSVTLKRGSRPPTLALKLIAQPAVLGMRLLQELEQLGGLGIVGRGALDKVFLHEIERHARVGMVADERLGKLRFLYGRHAHRHLAKLVHQLVLLGARNGHLLEARSIGLNIDRCAWFGEDGVLGEVGEHHYQRGRLLHRGLVGKATGLDVDGVHAFDGSVGAVDVEVALVDVQETALNLEIAAAGTTRRKQRDGCDNDRKQERGVSD